MSGTIYQSQFQAISVDVTSMLGHQEWYEETINMGHNEYRKDLESFIKSLDNRKIPSRWLIDLRNFNYVMSPEMQEWHNKHVFQKIFTGQKFYFAIINNGDFVNDLAVNQTFDEAGNLILISKSFSEEALAYEWLLNS